MTLRALLFVAAMFSGGLAWLGVEAIVDEPPADRRMHRRGARLATMPSDGDPTMTPVDWEWVRTRRRRQRADIALARAEFWLDVDTCVAAVVALLIACSWSL